MSGVIMLGARFLTDERGATSIEYAIIAGSLSIVIVAVVQSIGTSVNTMFTSIQAGFQ